MKTSFITNHFNNELLKLLKTEGAHALHRKTLALQAGISRNTLSQYFPTTEALLTHAYQLTSEHFYLYLQNYLSQSDNPLTNVEELAVGFIQYAQNFKNYFDLLFSPYPPSPKAAEISNEHFTFSVILQIYFNNYQNAIQRNIGRRDLFLILWSFLYGYALLVKENNIVYQENDFLRLFKKILH